MQATMKRGVRCSGEKAFLRPVRHRPNLKIHTRARAVKILIDPDTNTAYGVQYVKNRQLLNAYAKKEVISSAGAFNSPQLLMLSGIGPKEDLEELGIKVLRDLPVGKKMYDHITFFGQVFTVNESIVNDQNLAFDPSSLVKLVFNGEGPLTSLGGVEALLYTKTNVSDDPSPYPDMETLFIGGSLSTDRGHINRRVFGVTDKIYNTLFKPLEDKYTWMVRSKST